MRLGFVFIILLLLPAGQQLTAQEVKPWIKQQIEQLSAPEMHGRGYVNKGTEIAAKYLQAQFSAFGLTSFRSDSSFLQPYSFPINTFPGEVSVEINRCAYKPGVDYIVYAGSTPYKAYKKKLERIDLQDVKDSATWAGVKAGFRSDKAYFLKNADTVTKYLKHGIRSFANEFPDGLYVVSKPGKLIWTANTDTIPATIVYVEDSVLPRKPKKISVDVETRYIPEYKAYNVVGMVPGTRRPDSFIVFTAHFDHLGRMGQNTLFAGAQDNGSGTALVLYLAKYFAANPQPYTTVFMGFSGEEAGLLGSRYYVNNPLFPLQNIRFLVNLDMTGDATNGITVVNGTVNEAEFALLDTLNKTKGYLPEVKKRGKASNSDHHYFVEEGVPAVFIYANGTKGFYHDVFDLPKEISLQNVDKLAALLIDFTGRLSGTK